MAQHTLCMMAGGPGAAARQRSTQLSCLAIGMVVTGSWGSALAYGTPASAVVLQAGGHHCRGHAEPDPPFTCTRCVTHQTASRQLCAALADLVSTYCVYLELACCQQQKRHCGKRTDVSVAAGVQFKEAPPEELINQWQAPPDDDMDARLTRYARDHLLIRWLSAQLSRIPEGDTAVGYG